MAHVHSSHFRILVVEDHSDTANSLSILLRFWGHECVVAPDGPTGLKAAATYQPDLILLDLGLPELDGYAVTRSLRQRPEGATVPIWMVTGYGSPEYAQRAVEAGTDLFLVKPVEPDYLSGLLDRLVANKRSAVQAPTKSAEGLSPHPQEVGV